MLVYETEGFLEVESKEIKQLCRSTAAVNLGDSEHEPSVLNAVLCDSLHNGQQCCRVAFYSKFLKRAFVFTVKGSDQFPPWQSGQDALNQLGFQLEEITLNLSDAMLEVVLRDVPGILTPSEALKQRTEKSLNLSEFQKTYDKDPHSVEGKKAALKLNAEKRLNKQSEELRQVLEALFASQEQANAEFETLHGEMKALASKLKDAEALADSERKQRELSESITAAAEKRIQELEEVLVDTETKLSKTLKQAQKNTQLKKRVKQLEKELDNIAIELEKEREKQAELNDESHAARERVSLLEDEQKETVKLLEKVQAELSDEQIEKTRLIEELETSELNAQGLSSQIEGYEKKTAENTETEKTLISVRTQLEEAQQKLKESLDLNDSLEEQLVAANEENAESQAKLCVAEKYVLDKKQEEDQKLASNAENERLSMELKELREEFSQEIDLRKRLEKGALEEEKRIQELQDALDKAISAAEQSVDKKEHAANEKETVSLKAEMEELDQLLAVERQSRQGLELDLDEAHKLIDSLEKMLRETDNASKERLSNETLKDRDNKKVRDLEEKLKKLEGQLESELVEQKRLAKAFSAAEKQLIEQAEILKQGQTEAAAKKSPEIKASETAPKSQVKPAKPLPHEIRPVPKKGAFFHPDWDLEGLPIKSCKKVFKVWEAAFNVQISLEGYPSQYCMAFLVVLQVNKQKKVYLLFHLKQNKHTLLCVPAKKPKDEAALKKTIKEALNFLKLSGFEMDEMKTVDIDSTLSPYLMDS